MHHPQPTLRLPSSAPPEFADLADQWPAFPPVFGPPTFVVFGQHHDPDPILLVDGEAVEGTVTCELGGVFPACDDDLLRVDLAEVPPPGDHTFQLGVPGGLLSNEIMVVTE